MTEEVNRTFTIQGSDLNFEGGRYTGKTPVQAAKKAAKQLFRMLKNKDNKPEWKKYQKFSYDKLKFIVRETTRGSDKSTYDYVATSEKLAKPLVIKRGDIEFTVTRKIIVKAVFERTPSFNNLDKTS
jgi:hypothetical protein